MQAYGEGIHKVELKPDSEQCGPGGFGDPEVAVMYSKVTIVPLGSVMPAVTSWAAVKTTEVTRPAAARGQRQTKK